MSLSSLELAAKKCSDRRRTPEGRLDAFLLGKPESILNDHKHFRALVNLTEYKEDERIETKMLYKLYCNACKESGIFPKNRTHFGRMVHTFYPESRKSQLRSDGKRICFYTNLCFLVSPQHSDKKNLVS